MTSESIIQIVLAVLAVTPGVFALYRQRKRDEQDRLAAERDDNREDFTAMLTAARQVGDAGTALMEPLLERLQLMRAEMERRDAEHKAEIDEMRQELEDQELEGRTKINELEVRLAAAERDINKLREINEQLYEENTRLHKRLQHIKAEVTRLSTVETEIPREPGTFR